MNLQQDFGYGLRGEKSTICFQCHGAKEDKDFDEIHEKHVRDEDFDCSWCHGFSRPERSLTPSALLVFDDFETAGTHAWSQ